MENMVYVPRKFLGKTEGFNSKEDRVLNQKMLKAYLKGEECFRCGFKSLDNGTRVPNWFKVLEREARWEDVKDEFQEVS